MKYIIYSLLMLTLFSCNHNSEDLKIEITNTEIHSRGNIKDTDLRNVVSFDNYIYDSIPVNKINLKISNSGKKTYVLFIAKEIDRFENPNPENIKETVYKDKEIFEPVLSDMATLTNYGFETRRLRNKMEGDSLRQILKTNYHKEKVYPKKMMFQEVTNYTIVHPGETKFLTYYKTFPIFLENLSFYYRYKFDKTEKYYYQISLKNNAELSKKYLSENQLKEIETNEYIIFDGVIASNKIPIQFVDM